MDKFFFVGWYRVELIRDIFIYTIFKTHFVSNTYDKLDIRFTIAIYCRIVNTIRWISWGFFYFHLLQLSSYLDAHFYQHSALWILYFILFFFVYPNNRITIPLLYLLTMNYWTLVLLSCRYFFYDWFYGGMKVRQLTPWNESRLSVLT